MWKEKWAKDILVDYRTVPAEMVVRHLLVPPRLLQLVSQISARHVVQKLLWWNCGCVLMSPVGLRARGMRERTRPKGTVVARVVFNEVLRGLLGRIIPVRET